MTATPFRLLSSPHADARPAGVLPDLLVVHAISLPPGVFDVAGVDDLFLGRLDPGAHPYFREIAHLRVSAHFLIDRHGGVTQYVPVLGRAWHAGESQWQGRARCNDYAVGVELCGDDATPFEAAQYLTLARLSRQLTTRLPALSVERIVGHQQVAPGRKWDPGPFFDWDRLHTFLSTTPPGDWPVVWD